MVTSLLAGGVLSALSPAAVAQEEPEAPEDTATVEFEKTAYYSYPSTAAAPATATSEFPAGVICLVEPRACPESLKPVGDVVVGGIDAVKQNEPAPPRSPVPPDTMPVGVQGGQKKYESAFKIATPDVGDEQVDQYVLVLKQTDPTFESSSPAFRQAVLATLTCARENEDGSRCEQDQFEKLQDTPVVERGAPRVEACPLTEPFEEGPSQAPPKDEEGEPSQPVDCLFGTNGVQLEDGSWLFDLTFAVQGWLSGDIPNEGILLRPIGAENLAYGDTDPTKQSMVTFEEQAAAAEDTSPAPEPVEPFQPAPEDGNGQSSGGFGSGSGSADGGGGFTSAPSGGVSNEVFSPPADAGPAPVAQDPAPQVADGTEQGQAQTLDGVPVAGVTDEAAAGSAWWMWLLVPIFAGGAFVTAQSLTSEVALGAAQRNGAMTRLIEQNQAGASTSSPMTPA